MDCPIEDRNAALALVYSPRMDADDPELQRLLKAERSTCEHYEWLRGYPGDVQAVALALYTEAAEAVRAYRAKHPPPNPTPRPSRRARFSSKAAYLPRYSGRVRQTFAHLPGAPRERATFASLFLEIEVHAVPRTNPEANAKHCIVFH
jgi:hypothetical protein